MALSDPQVIVYPTGTNNSLPRIEQGATSATYALGNGSLGLTVSHQKSGKQVNSMAKVSVNKIAADPLVTTVNRQVGDRAWFVLSRKTGEMTDAELLEGVKALVTWLSASSYANAVKLINGEA